MKKLPFINNQSKFIDSDLRWIGFTPFRRNRQLYPVLYLGTLQ